MSNPLHNTGLTLARWRLRKADAAMVAAVAEDDLLLAMASVERAHADYTQALVAAAVQQTAQAPQTTPAAVATASRVAAWRQRAEQAADLVQQARQDLGFDDDRAYLV